MFICETIIALLPGIGVENVLYYSALLSWNHLNFLTKKPTKTGREEEREENDVWQRKVRNDKRSR